MASEAKSVMTTHHVRRCASSVLTGSDARTAISSAARDITDALAVLLFEPDPTGQRLLSAHTAGQDLPELAVPVDSDSLRGSGAGPAVAGG